MVASVWNRKVAYRADTAAASRPVAGDPRDGRPAWIHAFGGSGD